MVDDIVNMQNIEDASHGRQMKFLIFQLLVNKEDMSLAENWGHAINDVEDHMVLNEQAV